MIRQLRLRYTIMGWDLEDVTTLTTHGSIHYPPRLIRKRGPNIKVNSACHKLLIITSVNLNDDTAVIGFLHNMQVHNIP